MNLTAYRKGLVVPIVTLLLWVLNGVTAGDWTPTVQVEEALALIVAAVLVYALPNDQ